MERACHHHIRHGNRAVLRRAGRAPAGLAATLALALGLFAAAAFATPRSSRQSRSQTAAPSPGRKLAEKDIQVGKFYLAIGKYSASLSRFRSAVTHDPSWAVPHEWLGKAFEKKNDLRHAIDEYRQYLKMAPRAKDAGKIRRRMEKLEREEKKQAAGRD